MKTGKYILSGTLAALFCLLVIAAVYKIINNKGFPEGNMSVATKPANQRSEQIAEPEHTDKNADNQPSKPPHAPAEKSEHTADIGKTDKLENSAAEKVQSDKYDKLFKAAFESYSGSLSYEFHMYGDDKRCSAGGGKQKSASLIKLFIMEYAFSLVQNGKISLDDTVGGSKLSSLIESMITVSDNNATNILIDKFTMDKINSYIKSQGYTDTVLQRKMLDTAAAARGEENYTSASDVMKFLDRLYAGKESYPMSEMLSVMKRQKVSTKLRRNMPSGIEMASKTGELTDTENDAAIVFTPKGDYAVVCMAEGGNTYAAKEAMGPLCRKIYGLVAGA